MVGLLLITLGAVLGPLVSPYSVTAISAHDRFLRPSFEHPFGTDELGRDILTRVLAGARISLLIAFSVLAVTLLIGVTVGAPAGFFGGTLDLLVMRVTDIFMAFPFLVLAMAIAASFGPSLINTILSLSITWWSSYARLVRSKMLETREQEYILAARVIGASPLHILFREALPNCLGPIVVRATNDLGLVILASTILGFIGLGPQPPSPEWGRMIATASDYMGTYWWYAFFPGLMIFFVIITFALLGDELYESYVPANT